MYSKIIQNLQYKRRLLNVRLLNVRLFSVSSRRLNLAESNQAKSEQLIQDKIKLTDTLHVNYGKIGHGPQVILCIPGNFGTIETDFEPVMKNFDTNRFTVLSLDLPGYGKSRPPSRQWGKNPSGQDAKTIELLMKKLKIPKYSIIGWGIGGTTGIHVTAGNPSSVEKLIFWGTPAFMDLDWLAISMKMFEPSNWCPKRWKMMCKTYGEVELLRMMEESHDDVRKNESDSRYRVDILLPSIKCPTLILHGRKDKECPIEHARVFSKDIIGSKLELWPEGKHDLHLEFQDKFVERAQKFLVTAK